MGNERLIKCIPRPNCKEELHQNHIRNDINEKMRLKNRAIFKSRHSKMQFEGFGRSQDDKVNRRGPGKKTMRFGPACPSLAVVNTHLLSSSIICRLAHHNSRQHLALIIECGMAFLNSASWCARFSRRQRDDRDFSF
jgi:hypothetical protein